MADVTPVFTSVLVAAAAGALVPIAVRRTQRLYSYPPGVAYAGLVRWPRRAPVGRSREMMASRHRLIGRLRGWQAYWSAVAAVLALALAATQPPDILPFSIAFLLIGLFASAFDFKHTILPDFLTLPLLLVGLAAVAYAGPVNIEQAATGAIMGFLIAALTSAVMAGRNRFALGGGDAKFLAALGVWMGLTGLTVAIAISIVAFLFQALVTRSRVNPYGPPLVLGGIAVMILRAEWPEWFLRPTVFYLWY